MLRFQWNPDPLALWVIRTSLVYMVDWLNNEDSTMFADFCPESTLVFSDEIAKKTLEALLQASWETEVYQLTDYHWLLLYEVLATFIESANDNKGGMYADFDGEPSYLTGIHVDFDAFIDVHFWDTDFLMSGEMLDKCSLAHRNNLNLSSEAYGVCHRMVPSPEELELKVWKEG